MKPVRNDQPLTGRTVLIAPLTTGELAVELESHGARVLTWPGLEPAKPESFAALDEAIENLFGYDWVILRNFKAADFFLRRFQELGRDISELDALRVCAIGEATINRLDKAQVHIDVHPDRLSSEAAFSSIETYAGGRDAVGGLNVLIPRAAISRDSLARMIEDAGARVDEVTAYRTCSADNADLAQLNGLLSGGGVDFVAFAAPAEVLEFAAVFDTNDLHRLLDGLALACIDETTVETATEFGLQVDVTSSEPTILAFAREITQYLGKLGQ